MRLKCQCPRHFLHANTNNAVTTTTTTTITNTITNTITTIPTAHVQKKKKAEGRMQETTTSHQDQGPRAFEALALRHIYGDAAAAAAAAATSGGRGGGGRSS
jgi:hypothetical protein